MKKPHKFVEGSYSLAVWFVFGTGVLLCILLVVDLAMGIGMGASWLDLAFVAAVTFVSFVSIRFGRWYFRLFE